MIDETDPKCSNALSAEAIKVDETLESVKRNDDELPVDVLAREEREALPA
jgi:hypothetical protein